MLDGQDVYIKRTSFVSSVGTLFFKYCYSISSNKIYFEILEDGRYLLEFSNRVLSYIIEMYPYLKLVLKKQEKKDVYYFTLNKDFPYTPWIKMLQNHNLPMLVPSKA